MTAQARGFNAILVNLIEHRFSSHPPANAYGHQPFLTPGDFATPSEDYFAHADWVVRQAAERGILVLLAPAYLGSQGGADGWYREMVANGPAKLRAYGQYLGRRYGGFTNIVWVHGGDYDPPRKDVRARRRRRHSRVRPARPAYRPLRPRDGGHRRIGRASRGCSSTTCIRTVRSTYPPRKQYARPERMPFFLIESAYENEHGAAELRVRAQAYQALLSGACGHIYGNNPVWHFDGPGLYPAPTSWQARPGQPGRAKHDPYAHALSSPCPGGGSCPTHKGALIASGAGSEQDR